MDGDRTEWIYCVELSQLFSFKGTWGVDDEVRDIRKLRCAVPGDVAPQWRFTRGGCSVMASSADADRWHVATATLIRTFERVLSQKKEANRHLWEREDKKGVALWLWSIRRARRNRLLRANYDDTMKHLLAEFLFAHRCFRDQAADLTPYFEAERDRLEREERERKEQAWRKRAEVLAGPLDVPRWAYRIEGPGEPGYRCFAVHLDTFDGDRRYVGETGGEDRGGLTPRQVHAAFVRERKQDPYLWLTFRSETGSALVEWRSSTKAAWREITGRRSVDERPLRPADLRSSHRYGGSFSSTGPSSTYYGSGSSFGTSF